MQLFYRAIFIVLLSPVLAFAQNSPQNSDAVKSQILYQSPYNGEADVPQRATLIIRPSKDFLAGFSVHDFSFSVTGQFSGVHSGEVHLSDDNQTITFKPSSPFTLNEIVYVSFEIIGNEKFTRLPYIFRITPMSMQEQGLALYALQEKEQAEYAQAITASESTQVIVPVSTDTICFNPAVVVIDTVNVHEDGNIFFSPTSSVGLSFSFIAITSDTASKSLPDSNNFLFRRDIPIGTGNFRLQPDGTLTYFREYFSPKGGIYDGVIDHLDKNMNLIDTFQCGDGVFADLHDFQLLPNGHAILVSYSPRRVDMKEFFRSINDFQDTAKASSNALVFDAVIQELDQSKSVVFRWNSKEHFQFTDATREIHLTVLQPQDTLIDYMHINAAIMDPLNGNIIASFRHCDEVSKISRADGSFIWRWGGKHNQFEFVHEGKFSDDTLHFSHQHDPARIANGHITMFDNGNLHTADTLLNGKDTILTVPSSRAIEYELDEINHKARTVWEYKKLPYCAAAGNTQRLDNGNTMIGLGIVTKPSAIEVDSLGNTLFQMSIYSTGAFSYRTYRFPFTPPLRSVLLNEKSSSFGITSAYPNPAQQSSTITYSVLTPGKISIDLLDVLGHNVRSVQEKLDNAGSYSTDLGVEELPNGTYYCRLTQNGNQSTKMIVIRK
jgi:hypothetical protein